VAIDATDLITALRAHLFEWLPRQGWFDAHEAEVVDVQIATTVTLRRQWPLVLWVPVDVELHGESAACQVVVALAPEVPDIVPGRAIIGELPSTVGPVMAFDAFADPETASAFLDEVLDLGGRGAVGAVVDDPWVTTADVGPDWEVTVYRRMQAGAHPDVELPSALSPDAGGLARPPLGIWRRDDVDLATARRRHRRATPGAELLRASVDELLARRCQPRENPLDVAAIVGDLGVGLADLHVGSATALGSELSDAAALVEVLAARLPRRLDDAAADRVAATYRRLADADDLGRSIRVHGNLDLAAVEYGRTGWSFSRFGCAPESTIDLDGVPMSPLADLAGLLHGFGRCAAAALSAALDTDEDREDDRSDLYVEAERRELAVLAEAWEERAADALIAGYTSNDEVHRLLPVERISRDALLTLFDLELSVRDVCRDLSFDGDLLRIPVEDIADVAATTVRPRW